MPELEEKITIPLYQYNTLIQAYMKAEQYKNYCESMNLTDIVKFIEILK